MKKPILLISVFLVFATSVLSQAQQDTTNQVQAEQDTIADDENIKTGFSFGGVPALSYDADLGFLYGIILNVYHFGDGSNYPNYNHSLYLEWSRTTKGSGKNQLIFDSKKLIKGIRTTIELSYLTEQALNFYGFNGSNASLVEQYKDEMDPEYKSRLYYRHDRKYFLARFDFQGNIIGKKLRWMAGYSHVRNYASTLDVAKLNKGKTDSELLPDSTTLYDDYVAWGVIPEDEKEGGVENQIKAGLIYDTRDNEANPMKGIWEEVMFLTVPSFLGNEHYYTKLILTHRQYFTIIKKKMNFAYRVSYQPKIYGNIPFYSLPFTQSTFRVRDGLGGSKTLRGIYRNRIVGDDLFFANFELRWKFLQTVIAKQNFYIAFFPYLDAGMVTKNHDIDISQVPIERQNEFGTETDNLHLAYGAGLAFALNDNFIINTTYGMSNNVSDGRNSLYITLNFLF